MNYMMTNEELRTAIRESADAYRAGFDKGGKLQVTLREHIERLQKIEHERAAKEGIVLVDGAKP